MIKHAWLLLRASVVVFCTLVLLYKLNAVLAVHTTHVALCGYAHPANS
jgi:hypothetical protein